MQTASNVRVIPPRATHITTSMDVAVHKKKVAAYARVSTNFDEQQTSYKAQVDHYTKYIKENPEWHYVNVYSDEGISATSTKKRDGFNRMISDALNGKIDLILTKSVSRFARNTVDTLTTVRQLKEKGVEVYFEKENIYTMDSKGELLITIMGSLAQEESRSLSENVRWGQRKRFADGKVSLPYGQFLGYEKGEDGLPMIVEKEAKVVRLIYKLFLEGKTPYGIASYLMKQSIPSPSGKDKWQQSTINSILQNEKYKGDALLQKTYTADFLTKKKKVNEGEIPQYYVENSHPGIVTPDVYDLVQLEIKKRKSIKGYKTGGGCFSGKLVCGECGSFYGSKVWHSTSKYKRTIWQCNNKFKGPEKCKTPHLYEDNIKKAFIEAFNSLINNKEEILKNYVEIIQSLMDTSKLDMETDRLQNECQIVTELLRKCVEDNARTARKQEEYISRYTDLVERYEEIKKDLYKIQKKLLEQSTKRERMIQFLKELETNDKLINEFDENLWNATIEKVTVYSEDRIVFMFKDGMELKWNI